MRPREDPTAFGTAIGRILAPLFPRFLHRPFLALVRRFWPDIYAEAMAKAIEEERAERGG